ncbi:MAG: iron ABC transporter permease [Erysipelotrichaceae bacterium]|nr:iron ABC transporter permease [Erysipelotrichaceae bacterium]MDY5251646.1 iron ABC transporter permease [Erysipelotrichaceae bacterium]
MMNKKQILLLIGLITVMIISLLSGRYSASAFEAASALLDGRSSTLGKIIYDIRLPRIIFVILGGGALALSGLILQTVFKNPLASGDVLGTSSGCALGAAIAIIWGFGLYGRFIFAFMGGLIAMVACLFLANKVKGSHILNYVIAGMILQAICTALLMVIKLMADPYHQLGTIEFWLMGGFADITWEKLVMIAPLIIVVILLLYKLRWQIQLLAFGKEADSLGIDSQKIMMIVLLLCAVLISSVIAMAGLVSWVGLLVPHIMRLSYKDSFSKSYGYNLLGGAIFLLLADSLARNIFAYELPISILTSLFGAIFLLILFIKGMIDI